jgi:cytochrome c553
MGISKAGMFVALPLVAAAFAPLIDPALAGAAGAPAKVEALCQTCHGEDGKATVVGTPNLSGQQKEYLIEQLRAYRSGSRHQDQMSIIAKSLTDDDIETLADWYSSIKITVEKPK